MRTLTPAEAMERHCPNCHAFPGQPCIQQHGDKRGEARRIPHPDRVDGPAKLPIPRELLRDDEGGLWLLLRRFADRIHHIEADHKNDSYEALSAALDAAARELEPAVREMVSRA